MKVDSLNAFDYALDMLHKHHAVLATLTDGSVFLVVDVNGTTGFQRGGDLLIHLDGIHLDAIDAHTFV